MKTLRWFFTLGLAACLQFSQADTTLVQDDFTGAASAVPSPAEFTCGGPTQLNGSGELNLNTVGGVTSWVRTIDTAAPNPVQTVKLQFRAYAYAEEHWNPGVYGNGQPRGLRVGSDPDNVIEFYSISRTLIGIRTRANGVESTTSYAVASVYDWHDYEISVTPGAAVFKVDGSTVATLTTHLPSGALNAYFTTSGPENVPISLESLTLSLVSPITTLVEDYFTGPAGNAPDPAEFECGGPTNLNGSGELNLNTLGGVTSWVKSLDTASPNASRTVRLQFRAYAYAEEHWNPGVYGNGQPRGLRVGSDPDNVIEFYSVSRTVVGMRTRANGVESTASYPVASVYDWHDYEITVTPGGAVFKLDGTTVATIITNLPVGPLNAYFTTSGPQNVPISLESLQFALVSSTTFVRDDFAGAAGTAPDPTEFQCGGPTNLNGSGELNLNTLGGVTSWVRTMDSATPTASQTLSLQFRAYAYAEEHWNPGVYGNGQPRGLRVGADPDNVIEFYSVSRTVIGMRTRANGVESTASHAVASVYDWHDYEITVTPGAAMFKVDGSTVATLTTHLPSGALNAYFTTSGPENVPISLERLLFFIQSSAPSITSFTPDSGPVGTSVLITGTSFTGATAVKFGEVDAAFTVTSDTQITATVPVGATPGPITVTTPAGTAASVDEYWIEVPTDFLYYVQDGQVHITGYTGAGGEVAIPTSIEGLPVTVISGNTFYGCAGLTSIRVSPGITSIATIHDPIIGFTGAFSGCVNLSSIRVHPENARYSSLNGALFNKDQTELVLCPPGMEGAFMIPSGVTTIWDSAFYGCAKIHSVSIPNGVTRIGAWAFTGCGLTSAVIPPSMNEVGYCAFNNCPDLASVTIPSGVASIGFSAFYNCPSLTSIEIPASVLTIQSWAFGFCSNLASVRMLGNAPVLDGGQPGSTFDGAPCTVYRSLAATGWPPVPEPWAGRPTALWGDGYQLTVQGGSGSGSHVTGTPVTVAAANAPSGQIFDGWAGDVQYLANPYAQTTTLTMPAVDVSLTATYRENDFTYTIQDGKVTITGCGRGPGPVNIPSLIEGLPVTEIGYQAFYRWSGLTRVSIPDTVTKIGDFAFYGCNQLPEIRIPDSVTEIGAEAFLGLNVGTVAISRYLTQIGPQAFTSCQQLTDIVVDGNNPNYSSVDGVLFDKSVSTLIQFPSGRGGVYTIPNQVNRIASRAFQYSPHITGVIIPNNVAVIGAAAFYYCPQLTTVAIPGSVTRIEYAAFQYCQNLVSAVFDGNAPAMESGVFDITHEGFKVYCYNSASGFTQPLWMTYPCVVQLRSGLRSLELSSGGLNPSFESMRTAYVAGVPGDTTSLTVTPTAASASSTITVNGVSVVSGATSLPLAISPGTNTLTIEVTAPDSSICRYVVVVSTTTFSDWRSGKFSSDELADPAFSGDQADPAHDGISNLMKYALGLEPKVCGSADLPYPDKDGGYLTLTYRQNKQAPDVTFTVESGESLNGDAWLSATTELSRTDEGDHWLVTVKDHIPIANSQHRFMRLKVSR